jgi:hypothetical protein
VRRTFYPVALLLLLVAGTVAAETPSATAAICTAIKDNACEGADVRFSSSVGKLFCFSQVSNVPDMAFHVWFKGDKELGRARRTSPTARGSWRTWSSITIGSNLIGGCRCEVRDAQGAVLATAQFTVEK